MLFAVVIVAGVLLILALIKDNYSPERGWHCGNTQQAHQVQPTIIHTGNSGVAAAPVYRAAAPAHRAAAPTQRAGSATHAPSNAGLAHTQPPSATESIPGSIPTAKPVVHATPAPAPERKLFSAQGEFEHGQPVASNAGDASTRMDTALESLTLKELRLRAVAEGVADDKIEDARDGDQPKTAVRKKTFVCLFFCGPSFVCV